MAFQTTVTTKPAVNTGSITYKWIYVFISVDSAVKYVTDKPTIQER